MFLTSGFFKYLIITEKQTNIRFVMGIFVSGLLGLFTNLPHDMNCTLACVDFLLFSQVNSADKDKIFYQMFSIEQKQNMLLGLKQL